MTKVLYTDYECGKNGLRQKLVLIEEDNGKRYGLVSCPTNDFYFPVPVDKQFEESMKTAKPIRRVSQESVNNLIRVIEACESETVTITPELVFAVTHKE